MTDHLITTTMQPGVVKEVSDTELVDLTRMGVVASVVPSGLGQVPAPVQIPSAAMQAGGPEAVRQEVGDSGSSEEAGA